MNEPKLETRRLILRRFRAEDYRDLFEYLSVGEVVRFEPYGPLTLQQCVAEANSRAASDNYWAIVERESGKMIGNIYFRQSEPLKFMTYELGYILNPKFWGRGYATEAAARVVRHGFENCGAHRIVANCDMRNTRSFRVMERLGMRRERAAIKDAFFRYGDDGRPQWHDSYQYALLAEEFFENNPAP